MLREQPALLRAGLLRHSGFAAIALNPASALAPMDYSHGRRNGSQKPPDFGYLLRPGSRMVKASGNQISRSGRCTARGSCSSRADVWAAFWRDVDEVRAAQSEAVARKLGRRYAKGVRDRLICDLLALAGSAADRDEWNHSYGGPSFGHGPSWRTKNALEPLIAPFGERYLRRIECGALMSASAGSGKVRGTRLRRSVRAVANCRR